MGDAGSAGTAVKPLDITEELALGAEDDGILLAEPSKWRRRRPWLVAGAIVVLAGGATGLSLWLTGGSTPTGLTVTNETVAVTTGTIQQTVAATGTLEPASQANLDFAVSGVVTAVDVKAGQTVTAGQVLATIDASALQADLQAAQAQLTAAEDRLSSDRSSGANTSTIDSDESSITSAQSSVSTAQTNLNDASLTSTISGTVASVNLLVGQSVSGGGNGSGASGGGSGSSGSSDQVVVIGTNSYIVTTTVDDTQIGQVQDGDQATITPTGAAQPVYGTVASVGLIASQSSNIASFPVTIAVTGDPSGLYAGSSAAVSIIVKQLNNVTEVPTAAITYANGQAQVTQVVSGHDIATDVTVGTSQSGETQIVSGVKAGDRVVEKVYTFTGTPGGGSGIFGGGTGGRRFGGLGGGGVPIGGGGGGPQQFFTGGG